MILTPKNWHSFQHYKDRNPTWIKLHKSLLDDCDFQCLPVASKALAPMLWLLASERMDGAISLSNEALVFRLRMDLPKILEAIQPLVSSGFFTCDSEPLAEGYQLAAPEERRGEDIKKEKRRGEPAAPKKRRSRSEIINGFSEEVKLVVNTLGPIWPMEGSEGAKTSAISPQDFCQRVSEILDEKYSHEDLILAGKNYIGSPRKRYAAPQFFFGKRGFDGGAAPWVAFVRDIITR